MINEFFFCVIFLFLSNTYFYQISYFLMLCDIKYTGVLLNALVGL